MPVVNPGIRRQVAGAITRLFNSAAFYAPLTHTAVPQRAATGTTATFTRATTKTVENNDGYLVTLLAGEIGFPGARRVRNLIATTSEDFTNAAWVKANTTVVANQAVSPNGALTADLVYPTTTGSVSYVWQNPSVSGLVAGASLLESVYVKSAGKSWVCLGLAGTGANEGVYFDIANGVVGTVKSGALNPTITDVGDGWYRCSLGHIDTSGGTAFVIINVVDADNSLTATTNGTDGVYLWGAQLEDVTAQTTQTAGEYVSVGVESAPYYHGSMVDGVKCFPTDLAGNPLPTAYTHDAVSLNGIAGTYVSTPDSVAASITGDIDIRVKAALTDWTPSVENWLVGKIAGAGVRSYDMYIAATTGRLVLRASVDGTAVPQWTSTVSPSVSDGGAIWVRGCRVASTGSVTFYTSTDGDAWVQLGASVSGTSGAIFDSTSVLTIGSNIGGASPTSGKIYQAQIYNGINGTLAVDFDASRYAGGTTLTGSTGETWTLQGNAVIHPTNNPMLGYQAEGARTNLCLQSNAFTTTWTTDGTPAATQNVVGPDGATSAWTLTDDSAVANEACVSPNITLTAAAYTGSIFVKKTSGATTFPAIWFIDTGVTVVAIATIDTNNGVATVWTAYTGLAMMPSASARCTSFNSDFWRVELTATGTATTYNFKFAPAVTTNATQSTGTFAAATQGSAVFYGAQIELGSFASSYIPTTTIAVTRDADVLTYSGGDIPNLKTLSATFKRESGVESVGWAVALSDGATSNYESISAASATQARFLGVTGGATQWDVIPSYTAGTTSKAAFSAATNDIKMAKDGVAQTQDTSATVPTVTQLNVGHVAGSFQFSGNVGGIYGWTRNLSQSELNAVTS